MHRVKKKGQIHGLFKEVRVEAYSEYKPVGFCFCIFKSKYVAMSEQ